jgi:hypothetical protein
MQEFFVFSKGSKRDIVSGQPLIFVTSGFPPGVKGAVFGGHSTNTVYRSVNLEQSMKSHEKSSGIVALFPEPLLSIGVCG